MKLSSMFLLGVGLMCLPVQAQFHPIGSTKPLPESAVPNIVMAVEDEMYDYKQEKRLRLHRFDGSDRGCYTGSLSISPNRSVIEI